MASSAPKFIYHDGFSIAFLKCDIIKASFGLEHMFLQNPYVPFGTDQAIPVPVAVFLDVHI